MESYEQHCQRVFYLPTEPVQQVKAQPDPTHLPLDATSICFILDHAYKGNKASGPSHVPSQLVKSLQNKNDETFSIIFTTIVLLGMPE